MGGESYRDLADQYSVRPLLPRSLSSSTYTPSSSITSTPSLPESAHSLKEQLRKRRDAQIVALATPTKRTLKKPKTLYPLKYGHGLRDLEVWNNSLLQIHVGCPTFTPMDQIPQNPTMLDLACGYGHWCILAARFFKECHIIGLDIADIQPDLPRLGYADLAEKISWVHSDMLERLPFPDCHFDLVRSLYIEFCVPENKWAKLFEEIERVLKPGGVFETAQESMTFPCPRFAPQPKPPPVVAPIEEQEETEEEERDEMLADISKELDDIDPRDHSRVKAAFDAMVEVRFLNPQIIYTLPFYMNLHFKDVLMTPVIHAMLPPSSFVREQDDPLSGPTPEPLNANERELLNVAMLRMEPHDVSLESVISDLRGHMHLTQTLQVVLACKEAMWEQFEWLNPSLKRPDFDYLMKNWELDMRDRLDISHGIQTSLQWKPPFANEDPYRKFWRQRTRQFHRLDGLWDAQPIPEPCQSIRAFRGVKHRPP